MLFLEINEIDKLPDILEVLRKQNIFKYVQEHVKY